jgi:hypothetical protein
MAAITGGFRTWSPGQGNAQTDKYQTAVNNRSEEMKTKQGYAMTEEGVRLFYKWTGRGPAIVIPNGLYLFDDSRYLADHRALIVYDVRNCGLSDRIADSNKLERGILNDVEDLDAVRRHFDLTK